ncbi:hypothetical protein DPEC_G00246690 [Dallia pectoralis]|uniref:Uncharacterized protein n=1 Tax=Dallia pectoralis TaxID=75939 RepID=A0ACC2FWJ8_DALPE|nr:hypothetical protein DPEC_G00246690 [Dallia pectoralis]
MDSIEVDEAAYLGAVDYPRSSTWTEILTINGGPLRFKIDTGASVIAIPETQFKQDRYGGHSAACRPLLGPANQPLDVKGKVHAVKKIEEEVFIVKDLTIPLLGLPAIRRLQMIPQINSVDDAEKHFSSTYPERISQLIDGVDDRAEHDDRLHRVLQKFREAGLTLNEKCQFAMSEIHFLGHVINSQGIRADPGKIKAIMEMPEPKEVADVHHFMGMVNFVGKNLITADALSRAPLPAAASEGEQDLERECNAYLDSIVESLPSTPTKMEQIKSAQASDETCQRLS